MANFGYFPVEELLTLRKFGIAASRTSRARAPAGGRDDVGSARRRARARRRDGARREDGRQRFCASGSSRRTPSINAVCIGKRCMTGAKFKLDNLTAIVDRNFIQIDGSTEDVMPLEPLADKYRAFNWEVFECDGNDIAAVHRDGGEARHAVERQTAGHHRKYRAGQGRLVIWKATTRGTASRPTREQAEEALRELDAERGKDPRRCLARTCARRRRRGDASASTIAADDSSRFRRATASAKV